MGLITLKTIIFIIFSSKNNQRRKTNKQAIWDKDYNYKMKNNNKSDISYNPLVSILSPCYNEGITLENCIKGFNKQSYKNFEVLIINDGSTDNTKEVGAMLEKKYPKMVRLINKKNGGKANALNYGLKQAKGEIVICIDADSVFKNDTISQLVMPFKDPKVAAVAGNVRISNSDNLLTKNQSIEYITGQYLEKRTFSELDCVQVISGCVGAFRKSTLLKVGGYSSDTLVEDMDLTVTLAKNGYKIVYNPDAVAYTEAPANLKDFIKQRYRWCYGRYEVLKKHKGILFNKKYGRIGTVGLPYYLIMPWVDVVSSIILVFALVTAILTNNLLFYAISFGIFAVPFVLLILYIMYVDGIKEQKKLSLYAIVQSVYYSYLINYINVKAAVDHSIGIRANWNKFGRLGANKIPGTT
jgi:poly-beta-1,6 N-acetyl-D-glucosamine synthase